VAVHLVVGFVVVVQLVRSRVVELGCREVSPVVRLHYTSPHLNTDSLMCKIMKTTLFFLIFCRHKKDFSLINLGRIQHLIDTGRIDASKPITLKTLHDAGIQNLQDGVKILAGVRKNVSKNSFLMILCFLGKGIFQE
jgi:hypothetical protein